MKPFPRLEMYKGLLQGNLERCIRWTKVARLNEAQPHQFELNDTISTVQVHSTHTQPMHICIRVTKHPRWCGEMSQEICCEQSKI